VPTMLVDANRPSSVSTRESCMAMRSRAASLTPNPPRQSW
jgi:hypothetical protein